MSPQDLTFIQVWVEGNQSALEWSVGSQTFQICGIKGAVGLWERFFHKCSHPTRRQISTGEVLMALQNATTPFRFGRIRGDEVLFNHAKAVLQAAKAWCEGKTLNS